MSSKVRVSKRYVVFIPCYNAAVTIKETLESVLEAIAYTSLSIPVFIYDDCSKDNSYVTCSEIIKGHKNFSIVKNPENLGERRTTNRAFKQFYGSYDWAFIIHADDIVKKDWLKALIEHIEEKNDHECFTVWSSFDAFHDKTKPVDEGDNSGAILYETNQLNEVRSILRKMYCSWHISGAAINVDLFHNLGGFEESLAQFGDTDFFARGLLAGYKHMYISRTLTFYRIVQGSVSSVSANTNRDINEIHFLIDKHRNILTKQDVSALYGIVRRLSLRRIFKGLIHRKFALALNSLKQFNKTILK
jgi:glycosyltransferase involved in cell wall biosynthesis